MPSEKMLMRGSQVLAEASIRAGCRFYAGYPITPQTELPEYLSAHLLRVGGVFIQAESEISAINMLMGASVLGNRVMTSSSSPGMSLKQEGLSYMAGLELPAVVVNIMRGGPGLGNIQPSQADYFQSTRGGGHGDYRFIVFAPGNTQEMCDLTFLAYDLADRYRNPVMIIGDGMVANILEPVTFPDPVDLDALPRKDWTMGDAAGREKRILYSMKLEAEELLEHNLKLQAKYREMEQNETRFESYQCEDAEVVVIAYGTCARIAKGTVNDLRKNGVRAGLFRPISLWPFPKKALRELAGPQCKMAVVELSAGQMVEDVALSVGQRSDIHLYASPSGPVPSRPQLTEFLLSVNQDDGRVGERFEI